MSASSNWINTQIPLIQAEILGIRDILHGDDKGGKGLVERVNELVTATDHGCLSLRVAVWFIAGTMTVVTALAHFAQAFLELFRR